MKGMDGEHEARHRTDNPDSQQECTGHVIHGFWNVVHDMVAATDLVQNTDLLDYYHERSFGTWVLEGLGHFETLTRRCPGIQYVLVTMHCTTDSVELNMAHCMLGA